MSEWTKVITHPLGLAGFALFVVFLIVRKSSKGASNPLFGYIFVFMAFMALVGGIGLAYWQAIRLEPPHQPSSQGPAEEKVAPASPSTIEQTTHGPKSPAVAGVKGDVNITISDSKKPESKK